MLKNIGVRNYRSFDNEGVFLKEISKVNIIIGKNNSGKSNVLRFLKLVSNNIGSLYKLTIGLASIDFNSNKQSIELGFDFSHEELKFSNSIEEAVFPRSKKKLTEFISDPIRIWLPLEKDRLTIELLPTQFSKMNSSHLFQMLGLKETNFDHQALLVQTADKIQQLINERISALKDLISIPELRVINPAATHNSGNAEINGANIIAKLAQMQHPNVGEEYKKVQFDKLESLVQELLNITKLSLEITHDKDKILVNMHGKRLPLENYGSGVYQILLLCAALIINDNRVVCIEEPETHLHPELQRKFLDFLVKETNNTYFITTHSNTFINYSKDVSIYHIEYNGSKSVLDRVQKSQSSYRLLNDLGYKASDLLQSNGIIWVEGPSDRNYILKWISLIDNDLEEGLHFSIMFYGGKNLANVAFTDVASGEVNSVEDKLIPLLRINKNASVVIDSDIIGKKDAINTTKERIRLEIGQGNCWITKGKEIENYISLEVVQKWLSKFPSADVRLIDINKPLFTDIVNSAFQDNKIDYAARKNFYSDQIAQHYHLNDLEYKGLIIELRKLVKLIKQWNHKD